MTAAVTGGASESFCTNACMVIPRSPAKNRQDTKLNILKHKTTLSFPQDNW